MISLPETSTFRRGPFGVAKTGACIICGATFKQPGNGRPRKLCRKPECERARSKQNKAAIAAPSPARWTEADRFEAIDLWRGHCAICREFPEIIGCRPDTILPVCAECLTVPVPDLAARWLANCHPGCPLPNPYAGGAK